MHRQLWDWYSSTFQRTALQYEGKALLIFFCTQNTHHTEGIRSFFSGLSFLDVNSSKQQLSLLYLNDILYIESTLSLSSKKTSHSRYFTVIFKSATHIPQQGGISAVLRRPNTGQTGYITNFKINYYKARVSMTIISSAGAIASAIKTSLLCASTRNLIFLLCCRWENSQSAPVTHSRQVVKGPTGLLKITETALKCTSHAFQFVHLYNWSLLLLPYPHTILVDNSS